MKPLGRHLGLFSVVSISIGGMLGSGLFVLPGLTFPITGPSVWLAFVVAAVCVLPTAISKAEMATAMPTSGGSYVYIERTFGPLVGTVGGLGLWFSLLFKTAFALVGFAAYVQVVADIPMKLTALVMLVAVTTLNTLGVKKVGKFQVIVVLICVFSLVCFSMYGITHIQPERLDNSFSGGLDGFLAAVAVAYISYAGVTKIAAIAEEVKKPSINLPLGMLISLSIAGGIYALVTYVMVGVVNPEVLSGNTHPVYSMALSIGGQWFGYFAILLAVLTLTSMANAGILASSRFPFAMSRDRLLPEFMGMVHPKYITPISSIVVTGLLIGFSIMLLDVAKIAKLASGFMITVFLVLNIAHIVLRESGPKWYKPSYLAPYYPWVQFFGIFANIVLLYMMGLSGLLVILVICVIGALFYLFYGRSRAESMGVIGSRGDRREQLVKAARKSQKISVVDGTEDRVVVPLFGRERSPETLVELATVLADERTVDVFNFVSSLEPTIVEDAIEEDPAIQSLERRIEALAREREISLSVETILSRDGVGSLIEQTHERHYRWLIMDWPGRTDTVTLFSGPVSQLMRRAGYNIALFRDMGVRYFREILVLVDPGPNDSLLVSTADHLGEVFNAQITYVRFVPEGAPENRVASETEYLKQMQQLGHQKSKTRIVRGKKKVVALSEATASYDLLLMSAPRETHRLRWRILGTPKDRLTNRAQCSVLRLKTPHHETHATFSQRPKKTRSQMDINLYLDDSCLGVNLESATREKLLADISAQLILSEHCEADAKEVEEALWKREKTQNTAIGNGVAMPHATSSSIKRPLLGVFTTREPIDYGARDGRKVDLFFVTLCPPSERKTHLSILSKISKMILETDIIQDLRNVSSVEGVKEALQKAQVGLTSGEDSE